MERGLTQTALARELQVTQNAIFNWENGKREPSMEMIRKRVNHENPVGRYNIHTFHNLADTVELKNAAQTDSVASS